MCFKYEIYFHQKCLCEHTGFESRHDLDFFIVIIPLEDTFLCPANLQTLVILIYLEVSLNLVHFYYVSQRDNNYSDTVSLQL